MAKHLTEQELRQQAVRVLSDSLGPVDLLMFMSETSNSNGAITEFVKNRAISRQYHSLFDWDARNANKFFSFFGDSFGSFMKREVEQNGNLDLSVKAFLEVGRDRNRLVHQDFGTFALEKTAAEIYQLYKDARCFVEVIPIKLREFCNYATAEERKD